VIGCAVERQAEAARPPDPDRDDRLVARIRAAGDLPTLTAAMAGLGEPGSPAAGDAGFEHGLALLIAGVRARHAELVGGPMAASVPH